MYYSMDDKLYSVAVGSKADFEHKVSKQYQDHLVAFHAYVYFKFI